jgi:hypothetical protein
MTIYTTTRSQLAIFTILTAIIVGLMIVAIQATREYLDLPEVKRSVIDNSCVQVINYRNGDAYTCADVDVVLRRYHMTIVDPQKTTK